MAPMKHKASSGSLSLTEYRFMTKNVSRKSTSHVKDLMMTCYLNNVALV